VGRPDNRNNGYYRLPRSPPQKRQHHPRPKVQRTRARANKANDSEVIAFLREIKSEMKTDLSSINSKLDDINNKVNVLKCENEMLRQENVSIKQELSSMSVKLRQARGLFSEK